MTERMDTTRAREEMNRGRGIMKRIRELEQARRIAWDTETSITADPSRDRVRSGGERRPGESYALLSEEIAAQVRELNREKTRILLRIRGVKGNNLAQVLIGFYVNGKSLEQIAVESGYCYRQIRRLHRQGLEAVERLIEEEAESAEQKSPRQPPEA